MIDTKAFHAMSYGLYLITTLDGEGDAARSVGCVVNTLVQVTSKPPRVSVAINKENHTAACVQKTRRFAATVLAKDAAMELIGAFGFRSSVEIDKFEGFATAYDEAGMPYIAEQCVARFSVEVADIVDVGTHLLFIGDVVESAVESAEEPMTYAYYHQVKGGKTPPKASSYDAGEVPAVANDPEAVPTAGGRVGWRCTVCGYVIYRDELPDDFMCPICGMGKEMFERFVEE